MKSLWMSFALNSSKGLAKKGSKLSEVSRTVAQKYGLPKNKVYEEALKLKTERLKGKD